MEWVSAAGGVQREGIRLGGGVIAKPGKGQMKPNAAPEPQGTRSPVGTVEIVEVSCHRGCAGFVICSWAVLNLRDQVLGFRVACTGSYWFVNTLPDHWIQETRLD